MTYFPKQCDCGETRVDGKCPVCDAPEVVKPHMRALSLGRKLRARDEKAKIIGIARGVNVVSRRTGT